jgi:hypothetical protein
MPNANLAFMNANSASTCSYFVSGTGYRFDDACKPKLFGPVQKLATICVAITCL